MRPALIARGGAEASVCELLVALWVLLDARRRGQHAQRYNRCVWPLIVAVALLFVLAWAVAPRGVPWAPRLARLRPGAAGHAEWMAPLDVQRAVRRDYLATLAWLNECAGSFGRLARDLEQHAAGAYLSRQRAALSLLASTRGPRLAEALAAEHHIVVRHFSPDGERCLLVDRQTERVLTTRSYWSGQTIHRQALPELLLVAQMVYHGRARRWKIEALVQTLPARPPANVSLCLADELPLAAGRDS